MTEEDWVLVLEVSHACRSRAEFGSWNSIWKRFWRLSRNGVFETFFEALASVSERAHLVQIRHPRACVGGRRKRGQDGEALGRSRGGFSTKIHLKTDLDGYPIGFHLTGGEASDSRNFEVPLDLGIPAPLSATPPSTAASSRRRTPATRTSPRPQSSGEWSRSRPAYMQRWKRRIVRTGNWRRRHLTAPAAAVTDYEKGIVRQSVARRS
jgi:hypothetical protein